MSKVKVTVLPGNTVRHQRKYYGPGEEFSIDEKYLPGLKDAATPAKATEGPSRGEPAKDPAGGTEKTQGDGTGEAKK
jgi:hypothetical protein